MNIQSMAKQMNDVERLSTYTWPETQFHAAYTTMEVDTCGDFVRYTDYAALQSELAAAHNSLREMTADRDSWMEQASERVKDWEEADKQLAAAREELATLRTLNEAHGGTAALIDGTGATVHLLWGCCSNVHDTLVEAVTATLQRDRQP